MILKLFKIFKLDLSPENNVTKETELKIQESALSIAELVSHFREKCKVCGHHRIMHNESGSCEGVMNKPCTSGCDKFDPE